MSKTNELKIDRQETNPTNVPGDPPGKKLYPRKKKKKEEERKRE